MYIYLGEVVSSQINIFPCGIHTNESRLTLCPDKDFKICIECEASNTVTFEWSFQLFYREARFSIGDSVGDTHERGPISLTLITKNEDVNGVRVLKSLFQTSSKSLLESLQNRNYSSIVVMCKLQNDQDKISIEISG